MGVKLASACLCGLRCTWCGKDKLDPAVLEMVKRGEAVPVCPEQLGGLPTPREACEQRDGKVFSKTGKDYTEAFNRGAREVLKLAQSIGATEFIGKAKSPSCGAGRVYDGTFIGTLTDGDGVTAKLLKNNGIKISSA